VFHYREGEGRLEVDFIVEDRGGEWLAVEVKLGDDQADRAAGSLRALAARVKRPPAAMLVVTTGSLAYTRDDGVHVVPLGVLGA
jgi:predicted AAA+ superfamily ATPase